MSSPEGQNGDAQHEDASFREDAARIFQNRLREIEDGFGLHLTTTEQESLRAACTHALTEYRTNGSAVPLTLKYEPLRRFFLENYGTAFDDLLALHTHELRQRYGSTVGNTHPHDVQFVGFPSVRVQHTNGTAAGAGGNAESADTQETRIMLYLRERQREWYGTDISRNEPE